MYIETSLPRRQGQKARLLSSTISTSQSACVTFYYHMFGQNIGSLNVYTKQVALGQPVWTRSGNQQNQWIQGQFSLSPTQNFQVVKKSFNIITASIMSLCFML